LKIVRIGVFQDKELGAFLLHFLYVQIVERYIFPEKIQIKSLILFLKWELMPGLERYDYFPGMIINAPNVEVEI